jgi:hypothetical protein
MNTKTILAAVSILAVMAAVVQAQMTIAVGGDDGPESASTNYTPAVYSAFFDGTDLSDAWASGSLNMISGNPDSGVSFDLTFTPSGTSDLRFRSQSRGLGVRGGLGSSIDNSVSQESVTVAISNVQGIDEAQEQLVFTQVETMFLTVTESALADGVTITGSSVNSDVWSLAGDSSSFTLGPVLLASGASDFLLGSFTLDVAAIPEPSTYALLSGLLALCFVALRRR